MTKDIAWISKEKVSNMRAQFAFIIVEDPTLKRIKRPYYVYKIDGPLLSLFIGFEMEVEPMYMVSESIIPRLAFISKGKKKRKKKIIAHGEPKEEPS